MKQSLLKRFFISHLAALKLTLDHLQEGNVNHSKLITTLFQIQREVHRKPCDEVGFQSLTKRISRIRKRNIPILSVMYCAITLPESVPETIDHSLASFFLRNYSWFSLTLNIFHTLSQRQNSNFKHVNVGWEVLC